MFRHDDGGTTIKLDCVPVGLPDWDGWVSVFARDDPQDNAGQQAPQQAQVSRQAANGHQAQNSHAGTATGPLQGPDDFDDDIPF